MSRMRNKMQVNINIDLNTRLSRSIMGTEYEKVETKSYLEKVDFARRSLERNSVFAVYDRLIEVLSGVTSLAGIVYIISSLPPVLTALILFTVAVGAAGDIYRMNYAFDRDRQGNEIERNLYYARNDLAGNRYAKDIRVWNLYQYISGKVELYAKKLCDLWAKTSLRSVKVVGWTYIVNGLQYVIVYAALAWMVYEGRPVCGEREGKVILAAAVSYGVLLCLLGCGEKSFKLLQEAHGFRACNLLRLSMNKKFMRLDYADTEKSEVIDSFEEAKDSMWEFTDVGYVLFDDIAGNLLSFVFMSYILTDINPLIYVFVLILVGINLYVQHRKNAFFHQVELEEKRAEKHMNYMAGLMQDYKVGKEIRLFQTSDFMIEKYIHFSRKYKALIDRKEDYAVKTSLIQAVLYLGQLFAVYISAVKKYMEGSLLIGSFLLYISSINALTESIKNLLAALIELSKVSYYYKDYEKYMSIPENIYASGKDSVEAEGDYVIELRDVAYYYPGVEKAALDRISFRITSRDKVGIVGENGSGKSTLVKLLLRLYDPVEGAVYLNGRDIRTIDYDSYLKIFNTVFQDFSIFAYSILENIIFDQNADWEKIDTILKVTGFGRQMEKYKNGIESRVTKVLDDEGVNLSGGEQHKILR